jgi:hypothetical protein
MKIALYILLTLTLTCCSREPSDNQFGLVEIDFPLEYDIEYFEEAGVYIMVHRGCHIMNLDYDFYVNWEFMRSIESKTTANYTYSVDTINDCLVRTGLFNDGMNFHIEIVDRTGTLTTPLTVKSRPMKGRDEKEDVLLFLASSSRMTPECYEKLNLNREDLIRIIKDFRIKHTNRQSSRRLRP